ncbi:MAG: hypothetical protein IPM42_16415 [Saprospiraceae bacterium]|nr:hypothetical protein [Saprospiraceae bacterium]
MKTPKPSDELNEMIRMLEIKQSVELNEAKNSFSQIRNQFKPINIAKDFIDDLGNPTKNSANIWESLFSTGSGMLAQSAIVGKSHNILVRLAGIAVQYGVTKFVSDHMGTIKSQADILVQKFKSVLDDDKTEEEQER